MEIKELILIAFLGFLMSIPLAMCVNELVKWYKRLEQEEKSYSHTEEEYYERIKETKENNK